MMFEFSESHKQVKEMARSFAVNEIKPKAQSIDKEHSYPRDLITKMAEIGLMGIAVPTTYRGTGMDNVSYVVALMEIAKVCASSSVIVSVNNSLVCDPLILFGSEEQKQEWLTLLASGEKLGCFCLSESNAGSDAGAQTTTATLDGDTWVINGRKNWVTNGPIADVAIVFAMTSREKKQRGISAFVVPMDTEGVICELPDNKLGICGAQSCQIVFENVRIPRNALLGEIDRGFKIALATLSGGRIGIAAQAAGIARACLEDSVVYARERHTFDKPIIEHQSVAWKLADMAADVDAAELMVVDAASRKDSNENYNQESSMAKLFASDIANNAARNAIQIFGGNGYTTDFPVERYFRDAKITEIYEGTSEIQRMVIANQLFGKL